MLKIDKKNNRIYVGVHSTRQPELIILNYDGEIVSKIEVEKTLADIHFSKIRSVGFYTPIWDEYL